MYDVIIVGGGIAGCQLASKLAGLNVLLIEKNKRVILKDSGIVSREFLDFFDERLIKSEIRRLDAFSPSGHSFTLNDREPFAYIIKRELFGKYLRSRARKNAKIIYETVIGIEYHQDFVSVRTEAGVYEAKVIVGADGANSLVRRAAGIESPFLSLGVMKKTKQKLHGNIDVFFNKYFSPDFFSWIIPQNDEYGLITAKRPAECMKLFRSRLYLPEGETHAHLIPTGYVRSYAHRTLLVGDAAGQNKPLTGGGIMFGLRAANHAATTLRECRDCFCRMHLSEYEKAWKRDFAWEIDKQFLARMFYRGLTNAQLDRIFTEIGPEIEKLSGFDYDKFSSAWIRMPKIKMARLFFSLVMENLGK